MGRFHWDDTKNEWLRKERGVSFEDVIICIDGGGLLGVFDHPNQEKYPAQKIYVIRLKGYVYMVPFVVSAAGIFLKTIIPSRKAKKRFLQGD